MRRVAVRAIIADGDKLLLVRLKPYNKQPNEFYCTIGGGLDEDEDIITGLKREVFEETGIVAQVGTLLAVQQFHDHQDNLELFFHVTNTKDFTDLDLSKTSHGDLEIAELGFYNPASLYVLPEFLKHLTVSDLLSVNQPVIYSYDD